ncbi:thymidylate kinase-like [Corticium candelabrum]|uniref:thymidylate kinase-like n=1 Tax=Corticium candelabrum TaxID=121492 RepID=UPI002E25B3CC|nr:thymidylate kinase-like [Corticium candelabrum]
MRKANTMLRSGRGALVVLEGCDRTGKSTQTQKLVQCLQSSGKNVELLRFPDRTSAIGQIIGGYLEKTRELDDAAIHLLFAANRWEARPRMQHLLDSGTTLVVDRYAFSGVAFTAAKQSFSLEWCKQPDRGLIRPDLVIYLELPVDAAVKRAEYGAERYEKVDFQRRVFECYEQLKEPDWQVLDASLTIEDLHQQIKALTLKAMEECHNKPLQQLWPV